MNNCIIGFYIFTSFGYLNFWILHFSLLSSLLWLLTYILIIICGSTKSLSKLKGCLGLQPGIYVCMYVQGETELSFRLIPSLTQSHTKPRTKTGRKEVILAKEGISMKDNSVSYCMYVLKIRNIVIFKGLFNVTFTICNNCKY